MSALRRKKKNFEFRISDFGMAGAIAIALALTACATKPKTHHAPDATKVEAASKRHSGAVDKAVATAGRAQTKVNDAQKSADQLAGASADVVRLVKEIAALVPPELRGKMDALESAVEKQQVHQGALIEHLGGAQREQAMLGGELTEAVATKLDLFSKQTQYQAEAGKLAAVATKIDKARYDAQSQLIQQKIFKWVWRIGGGALVIGIIILFVTGKVSIKAVGAYFRI